MSRRIKSFLLAATAASTLPLTAPAVQAAPIDWGCTFVAARDQTDPQGQTWIEATVSYFIGDPTTVRWTVTCWLQHEEDLNPVSTFCLPPPNQTQCTGIVNNTRHTCSGEFPQVALVCVNPVIYTVARGTDIWMCEHVEWTGAATDPANTIVQTLFITGGVTTLGGVQDIIDAVDGTVQHLLTSSGETTQTETRDADETKPGIQCWSTF